MILSMVSWFGLIDEYSGRPRMRWCNHSTIEASRDLHAVRSRGTRVGTRTFALHRTALKGGYRQRGSLANANGRATVPAPLASGLPEQTFGVQSVWFGGNPCTATGLQASHALQVTVLP